MNVSVGTRLGPYEILAPISAGGMGEVYRARDTKLKRDVAVKVLPPALANDADRLARFQREAEVLASLNHSNIAQIYGLEEANSIRAIVMELVEGETLADVIKRGPIPIETAIAYSKQIVSAFEYAHDRPNPVIHRDLKPANVQVTPEGAVKVLDFGLAKALDAEPQRASGDPENSPTLTMNASRIGMVMGTAGYMSPEQAKGKTVDRRTDIWSFGVVLYEMVTGKRLFAGEDVGDLLAAIVLQEPDLSAAPARLRPVIERCLRKDVRKRWYSMEDIRFALEEAPVESAQSASLPSAKERSRFSWLPWALSAVLFVALAVALGQQQRSSPPPPVIRFSVALGEGQSLSSTVRPGLALSPDGTQIVYVANNQLYIRSMNELESRPLSGTNLGRDDTTPVFSPDGKSLAFWSGSDLTIKRVPISGGAAVAICATLSPLGMSWDGDGILFAELGKGILRVSPSGGQPELLVPAKSGEILINPQMLPGGEAILFTESASLASTTFTALDNSQTVVQILKSGARKTVLTKGTDAHYLPTGHLVYVLGGILLGVPFNVQRLEVTGNPVGLVEGVARSAVGTAAQFVFSSTGSLAYIPGPVTTGEGGRALLGLVDRNGDVVPLKVSPGNYGYPRVFKDGKRLAFQSNDEKDDSVWIYELYGAAAPRRLTLPGQGGNRYPIWSSDGERIAFQSDREGDRGIWWQRADGSGPAERLTKPAKDVAHIPDSWSPDGQTFSFTEEKNGASEVWTYSMRDRKASLFAATPGASLARSVFSPDGRWVAYQVSALPHSRIYLRPFPPTGASYLAPEDADSHHPLWFPDGRGLFYVSGPFSLGSVSVSTQPFVNFGSPVRAAKSSGFITQVPSAVRTYDILPDGKHFVGVILNSQDSTGMPAALQIRVVLNWFEEVKQRAVGK